MDNPFANLAESFKQRVRSAPIDGNTDVFLYIICEDQHGRRHKSPPYPITTTVTWRIPGNRERARQLAEENFLATIIMHIDRGVRPGMIEGMSIVDFELEIIPGL